MEYALAVILLMAVVAVVVSGPFRRRHGEAASEEARRAELEAAKEAKYREIRDAELDHHMGKLTPAEWRALDRELRAEAVDILQQLDRLEESSAERSLR